MQLMAILMLRCFSKEILVAPCISSQPFVLSPEQPRKCDAVLPCESMQCHTSFKSSHNCDSDET